MFKNFVIPHLDYSSQLWMPIDASSILKLEKVLEKNTRNKRNGLLDSTQAHENDICTEKNGEVQSYILQENN